MAALLVLLGTVLALLGALLIGDVRTGGGLRRAARRPVADPVPAVAPATTEITGTRPDGTAISLSPTDDATLLVFLGSACVTCDGLWRGADRAAKDAGHLRIAVVTRGPEAESARMVAAKAPRTVPVVMSDAIWTAHGVRTAPAFVVVAGGGGSATRLDAPVSWPEILAAAEATR